MSRPRSQRANPAPARGGAARPAGRPAGRPGVFVTTPKSDVYVALLGVALGSMVLAILLLVLLLSRYEFKIAAI